MRGAFLDITKPYNWFWHKGGIVKHQVSESPFKQNRSMWKNMTVLLYTCFYNMYLNVLKPFSFNKYITYLFYTLQISVKVGSKPNYFFYFMSTCINRIAVFNNSFSLICINQETNKTVTSIFFISNWIIDF